MATPLAHGRLGRLIAASALLLTVAACRQDMHDQPKYRGLRGSAFFADGQSARPLIANTVARGHLNEDTLLQTGKDGQDDTAVFPFPVTEQVMARGQERFNIYCSPCHGRTGNGDGMVVRRGYRRPPAYNDERLRSAPLGHFYDVITNGFGAMPDYQAQIPVNDRWAIVAYVKALQLSAYAPLEDVPAADRGRLEENRTAAAAAPAAETGRR
ncbi:MAG TPA: cytochrome c [Vicinamibacterales bacterium]|nr:cytochrome c [Vicinamibacterales bacterium]